MQDLLLFLKANETWIYVFLGFIALLMIRNLILAWMDYRKSIFGLEKEAALRRISYAATMTSLVVLIILAQFVLVTFIAPMQPAAVDISSLNSEDVVLTGEGTEGGEVFAPNSGSATPGTPITGGEGCIADVLEWTDPEAGASISGVVELRGTVNYENLGFYKYEFRPIGSDTWTTIAAGDEKKVDEPIGGVWNTEQVLPGDYELRLLASDNENNTFPACIIPITIVMSQ